MAEEGEWLESPLMVLMEDSADGSVGGVGGDGQGSVAAWMYKKGSLGNGILHLVTAVIISGVMVKSFLAPEHGVRLGGWDVGEAGKETAIEIHHAQQALDVQLGGGEGELLDGVDLLRKGADPLQVLRVTEEGHGGLGQCTLLQVHCEAVLPETCEHLPQVLLVLLDGP